MKILVDMNLTPQWCSYLAGFGIESQHWAEVGAITASDTEIMVWARKQGFIVLTHDLDFGTILAATQAVGPSVIQIRGQDVLPVAIGLMVVNALRAHEALLLRGALLVIDSTKPRVRILPLVR